MRKRQGEHDVRVEIPCPGGRRPRVGNGGQDLGCVLGDRLRGRDRRLPSRRRLIGSPPTSASTSAGQLQDEATYWAAFFAYRHATLWDYVLRDGLFFFAFLGFIPLVLAANVATGGRRAAVQIAGAFIAIGAIFGALNAVTFFVDVSWWRGTGWEQVPPGLMAAIGRGTEMMDDLSAWSGIASNAAWPSDWPTSVSPVDGTCALAADRLGGPGYSRNRGRDHRGGPDRWTGLGRERSESHHRSAVRTDHGHRLRAAAIEFLTGQPPLASPA